MTWLPETEQASLNEDVIMSIRRARSTTDDDMGKNWWCDEYSLLENETSFEIQNGWIRTLNLSFTAQVSHLLAQHLHLLSYF